MAKKETDISPAEVIAHFEGSDPRSKCRVFCREGYLAAVDACKGDRECILKATGHYAVCMLGCNKIPLTPIE